MAHVRCDYFSDVLEVGTSMTVLLPQTTTSQVGVSGARAAAATDGMPVLYLLHGLSDDATAWTRYTSIERYVEPLGLAVVMPQVQRSFYLNQAHGGRYWEHLTHEVPAVAESFFRLSRAREHTYVAGLSMGGYGAMKWALQQPGRFAAAASLSGALDLAARQRRGALAPDIVDAVLDGRDVSGTDDDLLSLLRRAASHPSSAALPALYVCCGTGDELVTESRSFLEVARDVGSDVRSALSPGGHEWGYWDAAIGRVLRWLPAGG
jgi:S-formylglutathione hydrolase FrmB